MFAKTDVNGPNAHPLFSWIKEQTNDKVALAPWAKTGPGQERDVQWNFSKFLCYRGVPVKRFDFSVEPHEIVVDIEALLRRDKEEL